MTATHAVGVNGHIWMELKESRGPVVDQIGRLLSNLDGVKNYSLILWPLPNGHNLADTSPDLEAKEYIQAAGSAEQMTVELRRPDAGSGHDQLVVGRPDDSSTNSASTIDLQWSEYSVSVHPSEVFEAREALDLFGSYYENGSVSPKYTLRRIKP